MSPFLKTALFTLVVPGSFAALIPVLIAGDRAAADGGTRVLALLLLAVGAVLYLRSAWAGRGTPAIFVFFSLFIRFYEEPRLTREFGEEYAAYMKRVGRWLLRGMG